MRSRKPERMVVPNRHPDEEFVFGSQLGREVVCYVWWGEMVAVQTGFFEDYVLKVVGGELRASPADGEGTESRVPPEVEARYRAWLARAITDG